MVQADGGGVLDSSKDGLSLSRLSPIDAAVLDLEKSSGDQHRVDVVESSNINGELLQIDGDAISDELQERHHGFLATEVSDVDLLDQGDHPGVDQLLVGDSKSGPPPELPSGVRANDVTPLPAVIHIYQYKFSGNKKKIWGRKLVLTSLVFYLETRAAALIEAASR